MSKRVKQKPNIPEQFKKVYDRTTCQKCKKPVTKERMKDCMDRQFWPVCEECEIVIIPLIKKYREMMAKNSANYFK